jgi:hypothetical protein
MATSSSFSVAKAPIQHVGDAVRLSGAPDHGVKPGTGGGVEVKEDIYSGGVCGAEGSKGG